MPTPISHAVAALSLGACFYRPEVPKRVWAIGAACAMIPDLDIIGFRLGIRYEDVLGHRGFSHSILFAALLAAAATIFALRSNPKTVNRFRVWVYLFLATASHGFLDAMTNGGHGIAFFSPMDNSRYFLPWTPIQASPIGIHRFFSGRGVAVLQSEFVWVWIPAVLLAALAFLIRQRRSTKEA